MKKQTYPENFSVTLRRETFDLVKESAIRNGTGLYRALKNYLTLHLFPYMLKGDYVRIIYLNETGASTSVGVILHLNQRLLTKAKEEEGSVGLYAATRQRGKNPLGGTEPTAAD